MIKPTKRKENLVTLHRAISSHFFSDSIPSGTRCTDEGESQSGVRAIAITSSYQTVSSIVTNLSIQALPRAAFDRLQFSLCCKAHAVVFRDEESEVGT